MNLRPVSVVRLNLATPKDRHIEEVLRWILAFVIGVATGVRLYARLDAPVCVRSCFLWVGAYVRARALMRTLRSALHDE